MKTNRFEFVAKIIELCAKNGCGINYDQDFKTQELCFLEARKNKGEHVEWFGIYLSKKKIEFWINDNNDKYGEQSDRYIFECSEAECLSYIQYAIYKGYEYIIRNYSNNITDTL
jgi:hypothetical protein